MACVRPAYRPADVRPFVGRSVRAADRGASTSRLYGF